MRRPEMLDGAPGWAQWVIAAGYFVSRLFTSTAVFQVESTKCRIKSKKLHSPAFYFAGSDLKRAYRLFNVRLPSHLEYSP